MNKRKYKKHCKKQNLFATSFVSSYKELKRFDRQYHEYDVSMRRRPYDHVWDMYLDDFENDEVDVNASGG